MLAINFVVVYFSDIKLLKIRKFERSQRFSQEFFECSSQIPAKFFKNIQCGEIDNYQQLSAPPYCYSVPTLSLYSVGIYMQFYAYDRMLRLTTSCTVRVTSWCHSVLTPGVTMALILAPTVSAADTTSCSTEPSAPILVHWYNSLNKRTSLHRPIMSELDLAHSYSLSTLETYLKST